MGNDEGSMPLKPLSPELQDLLEGCVERMQRHSWRNVDPNDLNHAMHLLLDGVLRKFCTDVVGPLATGNIGRPMPDRFDLPYVVVWCAAHAGQNCTCKKVF